MEEEVFSFPRWKKLRGGEKSIKEIQRTGESPGPRSAGRFWSGNGRRGKGLESTGGGMEGGEEGNGGNFHCHSKRQVP